MIFPKFYETFEDDIHFLVSLCECMDMGNK